MGCDIHCYIEYRDIGLTPYGNKHSWSSFCGDINPGRDYDIFETIAGVKGDGPPIIEPRGVPADAGLLADDDKDKDCYHHFTWLNLHEWKMATLYANQLGYAAMTAAMEALVTSSTEVRVIIWFDN